MIKSINPATDEEIKVYREMTDQEVSGILEKSQKSFLDWKEKPFSVRADKIKKAAVLLRDRTERLSELMTMEMGKPIRQSRGEIEKCAGACEYFAENAESFLKDEVVKTDASKSFVTFQPLGVILAIMPWNFPFWQVFRFAAPNLMAGNAGILKHSSNVSGCALAIEEIFKDAGFPEDLFRTLIISSKKIEGIINNKLIQAVTLTGSVAAGKSVASAAGAALKKTVLELGGSDPYVILEDADLEKAAETCVASRLINSGQSCIAAKRFIAVEKNYKDFEVLYIQKMRTKKMGDPFDETVEVGPQARTDLRDELHEQVLKSVSKGAKTVLGGKIPERKGAFYYPTVLSNVTLGMPAYEDELFGPVASLIKVKNEDEAIKIANDTSFGLGAAVFTADEDRGELIAKKKLIAGNCFINDYVRSDPRLPFGGVKESGYGRELSSFGIREFVNIKTVYRG
jgi:succinate-semialdehyde dehydrogenase/glutarate-semialdehyde dehydrogenase